VTGAGRHHCADQIARHLERARLAARLKVVGSVTDIVPIVTRSPATMEKIHSRPRPS